MNRKRVTSKDLAKLAGVSVATISRAFTPNSGIKEATRQRVLEIASQHGYQPSSIARSMHSNRSGLVAVVTNTVANPQDAEELDLLTHKLQDRGVLPIILCCANSDERLRLMRLASSYQVDHAIFLSDMFTVAQAAEVFGGCPSIMMAVSADDNPQVSVIEVDGAGAAQEVVDRLVATGSTRFGYIAGRASSGIDGLRKTWFDAALATHDQHFVAVGQGDFSYESGLKEGMMLLRRHKVDALICSNDVMAIGARDAASEVLGLSVPEDVSIVGHDGVQLAYWESHNLTTIVTDNEDVVDAICDFIDAPEEGARRAQVSCRVRYGNSTKP